MNILVTGAKGMVGTALVVNLKNIKENKNRTRPVIQIGDIYEYDIDSTPEELDAYCRSADFVFNLAGVNRQVHHSPQGIAPFCGNQHHFSHPYLNFYLTFS